MALGVHFLTLGCPKNEVDSDRMRAAVASSAYRLEADSDEADVVVVNTCSFIREATEQSIEAVLGLAEGWKAGREGRRLLVAGCLPARYGHDLTPEMPEVDAFVPVAEEAGLLGTIERLTGVPARPAAGEERTAPGPSAYVMVSDGCHRACTYCTIPSIRGPYRSRPLAGIVAEARSLVARGAKELVLIGQDISAYGRDADEPYGLPDVVRAVARTEGLAWLRLMYVQPDGVTDELLEAMAGEPNVCRYLDVPLQHASRTVLRRMGRSGDGESYLGLLGRVRGALPDVVLRTTVIAGFPGETRAEANELARFLEAARFDYAGVFPYSPEEGTPAAEMPDQVPPRTRLRRAQRLRDVADEIGFEKAARRVGETLEVLVEPRDPLDPAEGPTGRWRGQAPEIDGVVSFEGAFRPGDLLRVRIYDSACYDLFGEVL